MKIANKQRKRGVTMPIKSFVILISLFALTACDRLGNNMHTLGQNVERGYDKTRYRMSDYLYSREASSPMPDASQQSAQTAYCYRLQTDIVCYDQPVARLRSQLVNAQNGDGLAYHDMMEVPADHAAIASEPAPVDSVTVGAAPNIAASDTATPKPLMAGF
jgi:hypothetical protein